MEAIFHDYSPGAKVFFIIMMVIVVICFGIAAFRAGRERRRQAKAKNNGIRY